MFVNYIRLCSNILLAYTYILYYLNFMELKFHYKGEEAKKRSGQKGNWTEIDACWFSKTYGKY
jgi:hypothetical protein